MPKLLLHSLSELREVIFGVLDAAVPQHVVEIGSESGAFSAQLVAWVRAHGGRLTTIDPAPAAAVLALAAENADVQRLLLAKSPAALPEAGPAQLYVIDGDHNYSVVSRELVYIEETARRTDQPAIAILHDVGWPAGRRDLYYSPGDLPPDELHPHTFERGVDLDSRETVDGGFRGEGAYAAALHEGGPRNGVLTAIEDFAGTHGDWEIYVVPAIFGLGILVPASHPRHDAVVTALRAYDRNPVLARLEENRLRNYLQVIALQDRERAIVAHRDAVVADRDELRRTIDALLGEVDGLRAQLSAARTDLAAVGSERDAQQAAKEQLAERLAALEARWYARLGGRLDRRLGAITRRAR